MNEWFKIDIADALMEIVVSEVILAKAEAERFIPVWYVDYSEQSVK
jgi:hypothetical protein